MIPPWARAYGLVFAAALLFYLGSMAPGVLWQDSGLAQIRVVLRDLYGPIGLALSHPLYYLLAFAFQYLPFSESAFKTNLVSVVFGAMTVANVFLLLRLATERWGGTVVGTVALAVAHTFWQHCALAEVYTVSTALLTGELLCLLKYARTDHSRWLVGVFLLNGLGVSNHMLATLSLACYIVLTVVLHVRGRVRGVLLPLLVLAWLAGAGLYVGMIVAEIARGEGVRETLVSALFGKSFARQVLNPYPGKRELANSVLYLGLNFPTPAALLVLPGLAALRSGAPRWWSVTVAALLAVHLAWAVRYKVPDQYTFFIPALVLVGIVLGLGADRFLLGRRRGWAGAMWAAAALPALVYLPLPNLARTWNVKLGVGRVVPYRDEYAYFLHPWKTGYQGALRFAQEVRDALPSGAMLVTDSTTVRPLHYLQLTGRWRADVQVCPETRARESDYGACTEPALRERLAAGLVYVVSDRPLYCPQWLWDQYTLTQEGLIYRVVGRKAGGVPEPD